MNTTTIIDHGQQFSISTTDLEHILNRSEVGKIKTNGAQIQVCILINGQFARHAELIANAHSEAAELIREAANR